MALTITSWSPSVAVSNAADILNHNTPQVRCSRLGSVREEVEMTPGEDRLRNTPMSRTHGRHWAQSSTFERIGDLNFINLIESMLIDSVCWKDFRRLIKYSGGPRRACNEGRWTCDS